MIEYKIKKEDLDLCTSFANRTASNHMRGERSHNQVVKDIIVGKLGEIAYKNYKGNAINDIDWSGVVQYDGLDFKSKEGKGIQVKTLNVDAKWATFNDWKWDLLVIQRLEGRAIKLIGEYEKDSIRSVARPSNWKGWYFNPKDVLPFNRTQVPF